MCYQRHISNEELSALANGASEKAKGKAVRHYKLYDVTTAVW